MTRKLDALGEQQGKVWEGLPGSNGLPSLSTYRDDAGVPTNGWGHTLGVKMGDIVTLEEAEANFDADLAPSCAAVEKYVKVDLSDHEFAALTWLAFNIGITGFSMSTVVKLLAMHPPQFDKVPAAISVWNKITDPTTGKKIISKGLVNRRALEVILWLLPEEAIKSPLVSAPTPTTPTLTQSDLRQVVTSNARPVAPPTSAIQTRTGVAALIGGAGALAQPLMDSAKHAAEVRNALANAFGDQAAQSNVWLVLSTAAIAVTIISSVYIYWRAHRNLVAVSS